MNRTKCKKIVISAVAGTMLCTSVPVNVLAYADTPMLSAVERTAEEENVQEKSEWNVEFVNEYAKVGESLEVAVPEGKTCTYKWFVGGKQISNDKSSYVPTADDLEKMITVRVESDGQTIEKSMYCSRLPVIYIDTEHQAPIVSKDDYISGKMKMQGNDIWNSDTTKLYDGKIEIKGRGNSTWGMPKKPYKIKLDKSTNLMEMGKNKHWVLLANYSDTSLMRNTLAYNLSGQLGMPQMDTTWVDVVLNGKYVGNYQFCEQIRVDKNRVNQLFLKI